MAYQSACEGSDSSGDQHEFLLQLRIVTAEILTIEPYGYYIRMV
jgi:hypothetical protein